MEGREVERFRLHSFVFLLAALAVMAGLSGAMLIITMGAAANAAGAVKTYLARMAWLSLTLTLMALAVIVLVVGHRIFRRIRRVEKRSGTPYVDSWALAGKRFRLPKDENGDEQPPPDG